MFHTATVSLPVSKPINDRFFRRKLIPETGTTGKKSWWDYSAASEGVGLYAYKVQKPGYSSYRIFARLNFGKLATYGARTAITQLGTQADVPAIKAAFASIMESHYSDLLERDYSTEPVTVGLDADIDAWDVKRIDYCYNLRMNQNLVNVYENKLNKSKPYRRTHDKFTGLTSYYYGNKSYTFNFYSKASESIDKAAGQADPHEAYRQFKDILGVLRVEVQCDYNKLYQLRQDHNLENRITDFLRDDIATKQLLWGLEGVENGPVYRTFDGTRSMINRVKARDTTKNEMLQLVKQINANRRTTAHHWQAHFSKSGTLNKYMNRYNRLVKEGINPVCITVEESKTWGNQLPPLLQLLSEELLPAHTSFSNSCGVQCSGST